MALQGRVGGGRELSASRRRGLKAQGDLPHPDPQGARATGAP